MTEYIVSVRRVSKGAFSASPGKPKFLTVPDNKLPDPSHAILPKTWMAAVRETAVAHAIDPKTGHRRGDVLVFIHGYNNDADAIMWRHRRLKSDLHACGYEGAIVSFDWPSNNTALNYLEDRSDARKTAIHLVDDCIRLFAATQSPDCNVNVHLLAHSTGAYVIREAFDDADDRKGVASHNWSVSQIAFIGADVSAKSMSDIDSKSNSIYRHCVRLTNYQNPFDSVLKLSNIKRVGVAPRVGRVGLPESAPQKAVNVNCGPFFHALEEGPTDGAKAPDHIGTWCHSWHIGNARFAEDLAHTLRGDVDRNYIPTRRSESGQLFLR